MNNDSTAWVAIIVATISLIGMIFVPVYTTRRGQQLSDQQLTDLRTKARQDADTREENLRKRWQATTEDVDYLWQFYQDQLVPWMRSAYDIIHTSNPNFPQPPMIRPRTVGDFEPEKETK